MNAKDLHEKVQKLLGDAKAVCDLAEQEKRDFTDDERQKVTKLLEEAAKVKADIKTQEGDEALRKQVLDLGSGVNKPQSAAVAGTRGKGRTIGEQFVQSAEFQDWMKRIAPSGRIPDSARGLMSPAVEYRSLFGRKDLITGADDESAGAFVETDYTGIYEPIGRFPITLRQLVSIRQTTSDLVEFVRQTAQVIQSTPVAEANVTDYTGATGQVSGEKPEGAATWEKVQVPVKTIAVWIPATKRALSDAAQLRGLIDQELRDDVEEELEAQILNGDGTGENFTGLLNTAGILTQAWDTDILTTARRAVTSLYVTGRTTPTAWLLHPEDWETIDLVVGASGQYYFGGPVRQGTPTLWGYPVVQCVNVPQGTGILGNWSKAVLWDRERATIQVSDSHEDFFIRNMVAILCELRAAFGLISPDSFITVDLESGS